MPSKKQYNLVHNDEYDTRIPLHSEEAFHRGILFHAKFIGSMDVPRPTSRLEIVAAMRRIRYEFKAKGIKKKKVTLEVSVDGLKVTLRKKKKKQQWMDENKIFLMHHPIYRIFYVSHDSHDLKIFSYIARDGSSNTFKCNVFKSSKKSQAMRVVRTVGQAFEVCHKLSINNTGDERDEEQVENQEEVYDDRLELSNDEARQRSASPLAKGDVDDDSATAPLSSASAITTTTTTTTTVVATRSSPMPTTPTPAPTPAPASTTTATTTLTTITTMITTAATTTSTTRTTTSSTAARTAVSPSFLRFPGLSYATIPTSPISHTPPDTVNSECVGAGGMPMCSELTALKHEIQLLRERLEQQSQQTRAAVAHARLLQDQLAAESAARVEAQARTHQLLVQNKELLEHIGALVGHLREQERLSNSQSQMVHPATLQQTTTVPDLSTMGQCRRSGGQCSPWELDPHPPSFPYCSYPGLESLYSVGPNSMGVQVAGNPAEQLPFPSRFYDRVGSYQPHSPGYAYAMGSTLLLPTNNSAMKFEESPMSPRASSFASSPVLIRGSDDYLAGLEVVSPSFDNHRSTFIKPLPIDGKNAPSIPSPSSPSPSSPSLPSSSTSTKERERGEGPGEKATPDVESEPSRSSSGSKDIDAILRSSGAPPSRTTSARLPSRSDLMSHVRRTTWARHTTK